MFRKLGLLLTISLFYKISYCEEIDYNICPNGLTNLPSDIQWPKNLPNHFEIFAEITTDTQSFEITQLFISPYYDMIYFRDYQTNLQTYYDFQLNEMLIINEKLTCYRSEIKSNEYFPFIISQFLKPSILLGFNGRNNLSETFSTRYIGKEIIRDGILTNKFQSCFFIDQYNLTINATYYLSEHPPVEFTRNTAPDIIQIDIHSDNYPYTYNIIRYISNPSIRITTPDSIYCSNRINTKEFPQNLPSQLFFNVESYTFKNNDSSGNIDSYNHLIDETLEFQQIDYGMSNILKSNRLFIDYSMNLNYMYTYEAEQCIITNASIHSMRGINEILFEFHTKTNSIEYQYIGLTECEREYIYCHRWIGQYESDELIEQYEWYWATKYNDIDLKELIPIKVNVKTVIKNQSSDIIHQEINIFNYNPLPNSIEIVDSTLGECYRSLVPTDHFNYVTLRMIFNNDNKYPIHQYLLSFQNDLQIHLANNLKIRPIDLSSFIIDLSNQENNDIYVTFTLIDNSFISSNYLNQPTIFQLIQQLTKQINNEKFYVRINDGDFDLQVRPNSLQILVLLLLSSTNHTNYINETVFVYHNITQKIVKRNEKFIYKYIGSKTIALWTSFSLLGLIVALMIGFFVGIRKCIPIIYNH